MIDHEVFMPDPKQEMDKLLIVERALGEDGLIDQHLRWVDTAGSPTADINDATYGYLPVRFSDTNEGSRPSREPVDFQAVATNTLKLPYDVDYGALVDGIKLVDSGWFSYVTSIGLLDETEAQAMERAAQEAYTLDTLTEDNLPAYVSLLLGELKTFAAAQGLKVPAIEEWSRGIWTAEENGHMLAMNEYGKITGITNTVEHAAGRNSQLRAGTEIPLSHVVQLFVYTAWQELSTNIAHSRDGKLFGPVGNELLDHIGKDEARHHHVYLSVLKQLYEAYPDDTLRTLHAELMQPAMPGKKGIPNFTRRAVRIHGSGIFGLEQAHEAGQKVLQKLGVLDEDKDIPGLSDEAVVARAELREAYKHRIELPRKRSSKFILDVTTGGVELSKARKAYAQELGLAA